MDSILSLRAQSWQLGVQTANTFLVTLLGFWLQKLWETSCDPVCPLSWFLWGLIYEGWTVCCCRSLLSLCHKRGFGEKGNKLIKFSDVGWDKISQAFWEQFPRWVYYISLEALKSFHTLLTQRISTFSKRLGINDQPKLGHFYQFVCFPIEIIIPSAHSEMTQYVRCEQKLCVQKWSQRV